MKRTASVVGFFALLALLGATPASAQQLAHGTWTGTMTPPGGDVIDVMYEVDEAGGAISVVMTSMDVEGEMEFHDVQFEEGQLTFWWDPGVRVECTLAATDAGTFQGKCTDGTGPSGEGTLVMVPPAAN
jgi:hypothetical protein